jgi:type I restriction enzyme S subunit
MPSVDEQNRIATTLDRCIQTCDLHVRTLEKLRHLKTGLMQDLLTGKRRVTALLEQQDEVSG